MLMLMQVACFKILLIDQKGLAWIHLLIFDKRLDATSREELRELAVVYYQNSYATYRLSLRRHIDNYIRFLDSDKKVERRPHGYFKLDEYDFHMGFEVESGKEKDRWILIPGGGPSALQDIR